MRKPGQNPEGLLPPETKRELNRENLQAIKNWLDYLGRYDEFKESNAEPMQADLLAKYDQVWSKFFIQQSSEDTPIILTHEQLSEIKGGMETWHEKAILEKQQAQQEIFGQTLNIGHISD